MPDLQIKNGGKVLTFQSDGKVSVNENGNPAGTGAWRTTANAGEPKNLLNYDIGGADQTPIPITYQFNFNNQLSVQLNPTDGSPTPGPVVMMGGISISDKQDVVYNLIDDTSGQPLTTTFTVYGDINFDSATMDLVIAFPDGSNTQIFGDLGVQSLEAGRNNVAGFKAVDLLKFNATTSNTLTDGSGKSIPAAIALPGTWNLTGTGLVFTTELKGNINNPGISLGFAGKINGVTAGFEFYNDSAGTSFAFNISGQHTWNGGANQANWEMSLGYSQQKYTATLGGDATLVLGGGQTFTISGNAKVVAGGGAPLSMQLTLNASYAWTNGGKLIFSANVADQGGQLNYDLGLQGTFSFDGNQLSFSIKYTNQAGAKNLSLTIADKIDTPSLRAALSIVLNKSQNDVNINVSFSLELTWVDGKLQNPNYKAA